MNTGSFKLALIQSHISPGQAETNLERAVGSIRDAAQAGAHMVLLPEAFPFGWMDPAAGVEAGKIADSETYKHLSLSAREHQLFICSGVVERIGGNVFNSAVLINPQGEIILHHRKINELEIAHDLYSPGDRLGVVDTPLGRIGLMICADAFVPGQTISRTLGMMGAELILSPCAWAVPPEHDNSVTPYGELWMNSYGSVCRDFRLWIAGCSNVGLIESGLWKGHRCIGCSLVVGPDGKERARGPYAVEEIIFVDVVVERHARTNGDTGRS